MSVESLMRRLERILKWRNDALAEYYTLETEARELHEEIQQLKADGDVDGN